MSKLQEIVFTKLSVHINCRRGYSVDDNAIRYVLPVMWMTSCFSIMGQTEATSIRRMLKLLIRGSIAGEVWGVFKPPEC